MQYVAKQILHPWKTGIHTLDKTQEYKNIHYLLPTLLVDNVTSRDLTGGIKKISEQFLACPSTIQNTRQVLKTDWQMISSLHSLSTRQLQGEKQRHDITANISRSKSTSWHAALLSTFNEICSSQAISILIRVLTELLVSVYTFGTTHTLQRQHITVTILYAVGTNHINSSYYSVVDLCFSVKIGTFSLWLRYSDRECMIFKQSIRLAKLIMWCLQVALNE